MDRSYAYAALMIDLKKSRSYLQWERKLIQHYISDVLEVLNEIFREELVREMEFSAGDEVQGLFDSSENAYLYFRMFELFLHPVKLRAGIGVGDWEVRMEGQGSTSQDGTAYHNARYAIECTQDGEENEILLYSADRDYMINALIGHLSAMAERRSIYQNQLALLTEWMFPLLEKKTSEHMPAKFLEAEGLLQRKNGFDHEIGRVNKSLPFDRLNREALENVGVVLLREEEGLKDFFYITRGKQRGIPTQLANVLGMNRQSIEKTLRAAEVFSARNMALAALKEMRESG